MNKKKILLVDDEVDFMDFIGIRIESWGYESIKANSGKEALELLETEKPDLIVLDYLMPDMDGVTTFKHIRKINEDIPVIMFTAYPDKKSMKKTEKLGVVSYIPKLSTYSDTTQSLKSAINLINEQLEKKK
ncbi:response regulator [Candidatus Omnitrophota bacterium]